MKKLYLGAGLTALALIAAGFSLRSNSTLIKFFGHKNKTTTQQTLKPICVSVQNAKDSSEFLCYSDYYANLTQTQGPEGAFADFKVRYNEDHYLASSCHAIAHVIGRTATIKYPTISEAYEHGDNFCASGYFHGVMEGVIGKLGRENLPKNVDTLCSTVPGKERYGLDYYNCVHGMGHGLMAINEDEIPDALKLCDDLTGWWEQNSCYSGVFMENIIADGKDHVAKYLKDNDYLYPCDGVADKYRTSCYLIQSSYVLAQYKGDFAKTFQDCAKAPDQYKNICYQSIGRDAAGYAVHEPSATAKNCNAGTDIRMITNCMIGAAKEFTYNFHSGVQAMQYCDEYQSQGLYQQCADTVTAYEQTF